MNDTVPHSFTYTPDAAQSLVRLAERPTAWNQTWHVPTAPHPLTGRIHRPCREGTGRRTETSCAGPAHALCGGWFDSSVAESYEMLYQSEAPYLFDSSKFTREFGFPGTPYADGIRGTASSFKREGAA